MTDTLQSNDPVQVNTNAIAEANVIEPFRFRAMNTTIEVALRTATSDRESEWASQAVRWFTEVEERFSRFKPTSELSQLGRSAGRPFLVSAAMLEVLELTETWREKTDGIFDPATLGAIRAAGYEETFERIRCQEAPLTVKSVPLLEPKGPRYRLDPRMKAVQLAVGTGLDLGGIVKSWAVERFAHWLRSKRYAPAGMVNAGGDLAAWSETDEPWLIGIEHPWQPDEEIGLLQLTNGAVATSSKLGRRWQTDLGTMHHLIDPRTMRPSTSDTVQCTVSGASAVDCELWAKTICIAGSEQGLALMRRLAPGYEAVVFTEAKRALFFGQREALETRWIDMNIDEWIQPDRDIPYPPFRGGDHHD